MTAKTVFQLFSEAMADIKSVRKGEENKHFNFSFRGVDAVVNAVGPVLRKHGLFVIPHDMQAAYEPVSTSGGKPAMNVRTKNTYRWYGPAGDFFDTVATGESIDNGDKGTAKANSVAFRICLLQAFTLPTDDPDPDSFSPQLANELADEQFKHVAGEVERADTVERLRELWHKADRDTQNRITEKVKRIQEGA